MPRTRDSAALLAYRIDGAGDLVVFLCRMGGPFWSSRERAWSIPKGEFDSAVEDALAAARREFLEETGSAAPVDDAKDLGIFRQSSGKRIRVFAVVGDESLTFRSSNEFQMEWPPRLGVSRSFPEMEGGRWLSLFDARRLLVAGQVPVLAALEAALEGGGGGADGDDP